MKTNRIVAIQGIRGSFHHVVVCRYFSEVPEILECTTFDALARSLISGKSTQAIMAIENSIAGSIIPNYALIDRYNLQIVGEYYIGIYHNLMALPNQRIEDINEVRSHPMALLQCKDFFSNYPDIRLTEIEDTASGARQIAEEKLSGIGAIASVEAAELYGLEILSHSVQTIINNITRFVVLQKKRAKIPKNEVNKVGLKIILDHQRGSLAAVLNVMSNCQLNLTKIQSLPIIETPGKYAFFVDIVFDEYQHYEKARSILEIMALEFKILGTYKKGER